AVIVVPAGRGGSGHIKCRIAHKHYARGNSFRTRAAVRIREIDGASGGSAGNLHREPGLVEKDRCAATAHNRLAQKAYGIRRYNVRDGALLPRGIAVLAIIVVNEARQKHRARSIGPAIERDPTVIKEAVGAGTYR